MKMQKRVIYLLLVLCVSLQVDAQEMNARVTINSSQVQGTNKQVFTTLQNALTEFINNRKWTDATFSVNERIESTFTINISEQQDNAFKGTLQIQARRPAYNSGYSTNLLNFQDRQIDFDYIEFEPLEYTENVLNNNLTAVIVFYVYVILGLDFDSFSPLGGAAFFQTAQQVVTLAQAQSNWVGWKAFESNSNRHGVITALTDNTSEAFRNMWYQYHRRGLDEMAANPDRGRTTIIEALPALKEVKSARPTSVVLQMFADAKLTEVVAIYSKATNQEKKEGYDLLSDIYPTQGTVLEALKK
ncbi:DUF4835 family protein [Parabacteroides sp. PF5-6]|uniref:type IX secretion system protein PorD n=1 Tax=Parabacteroides sp. PF5-6 TaxID=1742403 RepID=UPI0024054BE2|nr:DUF4835 family protein [Parabacteroides sp. PF5-6]